MMIGWKTRRNFLLAGMSMLGAVACQNSNQSLRFEPLPKIVLPTERHSHVFGDKIVVATCFFGANNYNLLRSPLN